MRVLLIPRERQYSARPDADRSIYARLAEQLTGHPGIRIYDGSSSRTLVRLSRAMALDDLLIVSMARGPDLLAAQEALELSGARAVNPARSVRLACSKTATFIMLAKAGIPIPSTHAWFDGCRIDHRDDTPHATKTLISGRPRCPVSSGPGILQQRVAFLYEYKVYVIHSPAPVPCTDVVRVCQPSHSPPPTLAQDPPQASPENPPSGIRNLALAAASVLGLCFASVDILLTKDGPLVVDVNDFPSYRLMSDAPPQLRSAVLALSESPPSHMLRERNGKALLTPPLQRLTTTTRYGPLR